MVFCRQREQNSTENEDIPFIFACLSGNLLAETSSHQTGSSAISVSGKEREKWPHRTRANVSAAR